MDEAAARSYITKILHEILGLQFEMAIDVADIIYDEVVNAVLEDERQYWIECMVRGSNFLCN